MKHEICIVVSAIRRGYGVIPETVTCACCRPRNTTSIRREAGISISRHLTRPTTTLRPVAVCGSSKITRQFHYALRKVVAMLLLPRVLSRWLHPHPLTRLSSRSCTPLSAFSCVHGLFSLCRTERSSRARDHSRRQNRRWEQPGRTETRFSLRLKVF